VQWQSFKLSDSERRELCMQSVKEASISDVVSLCYQLMPHLSLFATRHRAAAVYFVKCVFVACLFIAAYVVLYSLVNSLLPSTTRL